jgi:DNA modification methylase
MMSDTRVGKMSARAALQRIASELPLDTKRRSSGKGIHSWYPYYAGFSESFARSVLETVPLASGSSVLDPWNGSGTTTHVADQLGFRALGFDVNPVAALVASAKLARPRDATHVLGLAERIARASQDLPLVPRADNDPLAGWLKPPLAGQYRAIEAAILADLATGRERVPLAPSSGALPPLASFLVLGLMRAARSLAAVRTTTNPTWISPGRAARGSPAMLGCRWVTIVEEMSEELSRSAGAAETTSETRIADARALPLADSSVDFALTSPPYCTRIDYVISTSFELAALGIGRESVEFNRLRRACMGTLLARNGPPPEPCSSWPDEIQTLLSSIRNHPSKASRSYYYKTFWQYFADCELALRELRRTLKPGGAAVLVVQSSYYKELPVDLPRLYVALGRCVGFQAGVVSEVEVRRALVQINSRSLRHRDATVYHESVVALERPHD